MVVLRPSELTRLARSWRYLRSSLFARTLVNFENVVNDLLVPRALPCSRSITHTVTTLSMIFSTR